MGKRVWEQVRGRWAAVGKEGSLLCAHGWRKRDLTRGSCWPTQRALRTLVCTRLGIPGGGRGISTKSPPVLHHSLEHVTLHVSLLRAHPGELVPWEVVGVLESTGLGVGDGGLNGTEKEQWQVSSGAPIRTQEWCWGELGLFMYKNLHKNELFFSRVINTETIQPGVLITSSSENTFLLAVS